MRCPVGACALRRYSLAGAMEKARRQIATLVRECHTLLEILDELDYDRYFRGLMRVLSDESLSHLSETTRRSFESPTTRAKNWRPGICRSGSALPTSSLSSSAPVCVSNSSTGAKGWRSPIRYFHSIAGPIAACVSPFKRSGTVYRAFISFACSTTLVQQPIPSRTSNCDGLRPPRRCDSGSGSGAREHRMD